MRWVDLLPVFSDDVAIRLGGFAALFVALSLWECIAPRRRLRVGRTRWWANLGLTALNAVVLRVAVPLGAFGAAELAAERGWGLLNNMTLAPVAKLLIAIVLLDLAIYVQHRVFHAVPILWRLHKVHHADNDFDLTTGLRFHTGSMVLSMGVKMGVAVALGASPLAVLIAETALNLTAMFNHANIRLPIWLDRVLRWVVVTPDMHRVHHSTRVDEHSRNFGFNFPWWDFLFRTYTAQPSAGHDDMTIGLDEYQEQTRQSLWWIFRLPAR